MRARRRRSRSSTDSITYSTQPTRDGFAGDQTLFAPPFTSTDDELAEMVERFAAAVRQVATEVERKLRGAGDRGCDDPQTLLRALILQHEEPTPPGLHRRLAGEQRRMSTFFASIWTSAIVDPRDYDLIVSLGSEFAAFDDSIPFIPRETRASARRGKADVPVLGLCFGGQLLARVLGGKSFRCGDMRRSAGCRCAPTTRTWCPRARGSTGISTRSRSPPGAKLIADRPVAPQAYVVGTKPWRCSSTPR